MQIILAKTAGFCFGVNRAVKLTYELLEQGRPVATLGPLIHNPQVVEDLESKGAITCDSVDDVPDGYEVVIRSHGVGQSVYDKISTRRLAYHDATCPFVAKIHNIVSKSECPVIIAGDPDHPEVIGIVGHCRNPDEVTVVRDSDELEKMAELQKFPRQNALIMVAQTTFNSSKWQSCIQVAKKHYTNITIFDTICSATAERQKETEELARRSALMVTVGGKNSSNTAKLAQISQKHCPVIFTQDGSDIDKAAVSELLPLQGGTVGITAGASTPAYIIKEVHRIMSEILNNEEGFDFMAEVDKTFKKVYIGNRVKALVVAVNKNEAVVDLGTKHSGYIPASELSQDPNAAPSDVVKVGDEIEAIVTAVNDAEGTVTLSKKKVDSVLGVEKLAAAMENNETLEGEVSSVVKGGVIIISNGTRVFIPASQTGVPKDGKLEELLKKTVPFKVIEVTEARGRVVGSIRQAKKEANDAAKAKFWENIEVGQKFTGEVKSIESYGVFVDLGGVDGMVHSSELTWNRIKHPREIVKIGDKLDVYVKSFDPEKKRVSLGCKKEEDNPWVKLENEVPVGTEFTAPVVSITKFGAFVRIMPGIDGLVHISEISNERVNKVSDVLKVGDEVRVKLTAVDFDRKRISLSMKACLDENGEDAE